MNANAITEWRTCKRFSIFFSMKNFAHVCLNGTHTSFCISLFFSYIPFIYSALEYLHRDARARFFAEKYDMRKRGTHATDHHHHHFCFVIADERERHKQNFGKRSVLCMHGTLLTRSSKTLTLTFFLIFLLSQLLSIINCVCMFIYFWHTHNRIKTAVFLLKKGKNKTTSKKEWIKF